MLPDIKQNSSSNNSQAKPQLERVPASIDPADFYQRFILQRRPCILQNVFSKVITGGKNNNKSPLLFPTMITSDLLQKVAGDETVQVERRFAVEEAFGQNRTTDRQVQMTMSDFVALVTGGQGDSETRSHKEEEEDDSNNSKTKNSGLYYYLSTQQPALSQKDNKNSNNTESEHHFLFATPCQQLLQQGYIPAHIPWAGPLVLQSCNLWMGSTATTTTTTTSAAATTTTSSGLHHDFHDNWYIVFAGRKTFRLYAPVDYDCMELYGTVQCLHPNGLLSYQSNPLRADGIPVVVRPDKEESEEDDDDDDDGDEEEVVLGKGFDYHDDEDDDDDDVENPDFDGKDDYDELVGDEDDLFVGDKNDYENEKEKTDSRPDSFSRIDLTAPRAEIEAKYPDFARCREVVVSLGTGECLYLPASWFHCVMSQNAVDDNNGTSTSTPPPPPYHLALNYWYFPPDRLSDNDNDDNSGSSQQKQPYADTSYWRRIREEQAAKIAALKLPMT